MRIKVFLGSLLLIMVLVFVPIPRVTAQTPAPSDDQVNQVAKQIYCPVCENIPLDVCGTQACAQWRELIREKLAAGWSQAQIENYFAQQYGARVLAVSPGGGLNGLIYLLPIIAVLIGMVFIWRRYGRKKSPQDASLKNVDAQYLQTIKAELNQREDRS